MADIFTREERSRIMSRIRGTNTKPEMAVRKRLYSMGYRYRLHYSELPGKPDIVLPKHKKAIFVHGCFWHSHLNCRRASVPSSNKAFWKRKLLGNARRDRQNYRRLNALGWSYKVVWQCEIPNGNRLLLKLINYLEG